MSDYGTDSFITPLYTFLGSVALVYFPLGNLRVPSLDSSRDNADIQHCATLCLLRHIKSNDAIKLVSEY